MNTCEYYVYIYLDPRQSGMWDYCDTTFEYEPFYVGKGKNSRYKMHKRKCYYNKKHSHKYHRIKNIIDAGYEPIILILFDNMIESDALEKETDIIKTLGTRSNISGVPHGPLTNLKTEGVTQQYSDESKKKMSESRKKVVGWRHTEETKLKIGNSNKISHSTPEAKMRSSRTHKGKKLSQYQLDILSKTHKGKVISQSMRNAISLKLKGRIHTEESKLKMTQSQLCTWEMQSQQSSDIFQVADIQQWCKNNNINYSSIYGTMSRNKFHKGYKLLKKVYDPRA